MRKITIKISESIRVAPYEVIKPEIAMEFEVPDDVNLEDFYREKYKVVKRIWNMHLYNQLFNVKKRQKEDNVFEFARMLMKGKEEFPTFKFKEQDEIKEQK